MGRCCGLEAVVAATGLAPRVASQPTVLGLAPNTASRSAGLRAALLGLRARASMTLCVGDLG